MEKSEMNASLENNRFERAYQRIRKNKIKAIMLALVLLFIAENILAWSYVAKRSFSDLPSVDLIERFFVLRPFQSKFIQQYTFPIELWSEYKGESSLPDGQRGLYSADSLLGYRLSPNSITTDSIWTWRGTNAQGLIITDRHDYKMEYKIPKPDNLYRIIILGGSTVEGDGASGSTTALPAMLQDVLTSNYTIAKHPRSRIQVINAGVGGYFSALELLYYISDMRHFQPDLVIAYNGWNDLKIQNDALQNRGPMPPQLWHPHTEKNNRILNNYYKYWPTFYRSTELLAQRGMEFLERFTTFYMPKRVLVQLFNYVLRNEKKSAVQAERNVAFTPNSVRRYVDNIEMLVLRNRTDNVATAWFLQPLVGLGNRAPVHRGRSYILLYPNHIERLKKFYRLAEQSQQEFLRKYPGSPLVCAASLVNVFDGNTDEVFEDNGHLYDSGNIIVARRIAKELEACGLITAKLNLGKK